MNNNSAPPAPAAPDYAASYSAGIQANVDSLPEQRIIQNAASMGTKVTYTDSKGKQQTADFTGMGDDAATMNQVKVQGEAADASAANALALQQKYGAGYVQEQNDLTRLSDPTRYDALQDYGKTVTSNFDLGSTLDAQTQREVEQTARGAQAARGNTLGNASAFDEAMQVGQAGLALKAQRTAAMQSYLGLAPTSAQYGGVNSAGGPVATTGAYNTSLPSLDPNAGNQGANFASTQFGQMSNLWTSQAQYQASKPDYLAMGIGALAGVGGTAAKMAI
jgi:hypothetical protein